MDPNEDTENIIHSEDFKEVLEDAISSIENESIMNLTTEKITEYKNNILDELSIAEEPREKILRGLQEYRYIDDLNDFTLGEYIRWINLAKVETEGFVLAKGAFISDIEMNKEDVLLTCKLCPSSRYSRQIYIKLRGGENIIFQKLSNQEKIILSALDYISKK